MVSPRLIRYPPLPPSPLNPPVEKRTVVPPDIVAVPPLPKPALPPVKIKVPPPLMARLVPAPESSFFLFSSFQLQVMVAVAGRLMGPPLGMMLPGEVPKVMFPEFTVPETVTVPAASPLAEEPKFRLSAVVVA